MVAIDNAIDPLLLLHTPPIVVSERITDEPGHTLSAPVMGVGVGKTTTGTSTLHPVGSV